MRSAPPIEKDIAAEAAGGRVQYRLMNASSPPTGGEVRVSYARTHDTWADPQRRARAARWLSAAEQARHHRFRHDEDRDMFLLGRVMARALVGRALGVEPCAWQWAEGPRGRPEVSGHPSPVSFNLAHSAGMVVCALSHDGAVGVDVEHRHRPPTDPQIVRRFCSPAEIIDIERHGTDGWRDQFLRYWTLKEAYLKARGVGIAVHLADVSFTLGDTMRVDFLNSLHGTDTNWAFALTEPDGSHFVAAATPAAPGAHPRFMFEPFPEHLLP